MRDDQLRDMLRDSSPEQLDAPSTPSVLHGVQHRLRRRSRQRSAVGASCAVLLAAFLHVSQLAPIPEREDAPVLAVELDQDFAKEAEMQAEVVRRLLLREQQQERIAALQAELDRPLPLEAVQSQIQGQLDLAAATLFENGERLRADRLQRSACSRYTRVVNTYPGSSWARLAQARLVNCNDF